MKKLLLALLMLGGIQQSSMAANGDTTWVQAHAGLQMDNYNNFDTLVTFPDGSVDYRKVFMHFNLGKYVCPGSPQYCGDWDYDVHTYIMTPTDTFELGRLITPYAHTGYGRFTATWTHDYIFDVSDYQDYLKDNATVRILYAGYSGGFTADVKFQFIEGTPERNVLAINRTWNGGFDYGHGPTLINDALQVLSFTPPAGTVTTVMQSWITGHGGDDKSCAEFCPSHYTLDVNSTPSFTQDFWREDCSGNNVYPQSGTWILNRANWCPGDLVHPFYHTINSAIAGTPFTMDMSFPAYTSTTNLPNTFAASYKLDGAVIYYGAYNKMVDATLEDIVAPTNSEVHFRKNPLLGTPEVMVRNSGSTTLTSIKFDYGIVGQSTQSYTWTGSLASSQTANITFPKLDELKLASGNYEFMVKITEANGAADNDNSNDELRSTFTAAPLWPIDFRIDLSNKNNGNTKWWIEDLNGVVAAQKLDCAEDALCVDTVHLVGNTPYRLVVSDSLLFGYTDIPSNTTIGSPNGDGLNFFTNDPGFFRVYPIGSINQINVPKNYEGDFGFGFVHYFYTDMPSSVQQVNNDAAIEVYPNPSTGMFTLNYAFKGNAGKNASYTVSDLTSKTIMAGTLNASATQQVIDMTGKPAGIYVLQVRAEGVSWTQKVILK